MCGIAGYLYARPSSMGLDHLTQLRAMADAVLLRGPDGGGEWFDRDAGIGFAHRRLAILELSPAGHQPMHSQDERFVLTFNGEIYNHLLLRRILEEGGQAPAWRGRSDTETLLAAFVAWGIEETLRRSNGMFALALWDRQDRILTLARDRTGEKPLYYGLQRGAFLFGSELGALERHADFEGEIDRNALALFMRHNCIPAPYSIYRNIWKLPPASILRISAASHTPEVTAYWSPIEVAVNGRGFAGSAVEAVDELDTLLRSVVEQQMIADVPLGAFLSGGIDSSTIAALMQAQSTRPVKTFTIGFHESDFDEARHANEVAQYLGTEHYELYITSTNAMDVIPRLPDLYDEPFADSSQIPTFLVAQLARSHVTVALSGDAGDELFCGYNRYRMTSRAWKYLQHMPLSIRRLVSRGIYAFPPDAWNRVINPFQRLLPKGQHAANVGDRLHKIAGLIDSNSAAELYRHFISHWWDPASIVLGSREPPTFVDTIGPLLSGLSDIEKMMALDLITYLPDDNLVKVDRAAMGNSLETRIPMLDHRIVEFAWSLPQDYKLHRGTTKWVLREVLARYVPRALFERRKMGFAIPIGAWLRGPLRAWAEDLLAPERLRDEGFFNVEIVRKHWEEHLSGHRNWHYQLWNVLMFQAWIGQKRGAASTSLNRQA